MDAVYLGLLTGLLLITLGIVVGLERLGSGS